MAEREVEVFYPGDGVMFIGTKWELEQHQQVAARHGMSIADVARAVSEAVMAELDPIKAEGEPFVFRKCFLTDLLFLNSVPDPYANVDLRVAREEFKQDSFSSWVRGENSGQALIGKKVLCFPDVRLKPPKWYGTSRDRGGLDHVSQELLLNITGGDPITLGRKYVGPWHGLIMGKVILISNLPPDLGDGVLPTRFVMVKFGQSFLGKEDLDLQEKRLRPELPGIAVRCLTAYRRLKVRGRFIQPKSANWLQQDVMANSNPYAAFVAKHIVIEDGAEVACSMVQLKFEGWCKENGQLDVLRSTTKSLLSVKLREEGGLPTLRTCRPHGEPRRYAGIRLKTFKESREGEEV